MNEIISRNHNEFLLELKNNNLRNKIKRLIFRRHFLPQERVL